MEYKLTNQDVWLSTMIFIVLDIFILVPLVLKFDYPKDKDIVWFVGGVSALLWGIFGTLVIYGFWEFYYQYLFPQWMRWLAPVDAILYGAIGLALWWLAGRFHAANLLWFVLLGGLEGILEHLVGIYLMQILDKVPWLEGISPSSVLVFSFFEYIFYWSIVAWFIFVFSKMLRI